MEFLTDPFGYLMLHQPRLVGAAVTYLVFVKVITAIRDVLDKTPDTDDNDFERLATILKKLGGLLIAGDRPKAPDSAKAEPGAAADATGVKVEEKKP